MGERQTERPEAEFRKHALHGGGMRRRGRGSGRETFLEPGARYLSLFQALGHSPAGPSFPYQDNPVTQVPRVVSVPTLEATSMSGW